LAFPSALPDCKVRHSSADSASAKSDIDDIVALTLRHEIPTMSERGADVIAAGLMSYGAAQMDAWRQGGIYVA